MSRYKEMPGESYQIVEQDSSSATVEFTYLCPYCRNQATAVKTYYSDFEKLENGMFFDSLTCDNCGKTSNVRYYRSNRIY